MFANYRSNSFYIWTHLMLTFMKAAITRIGSITVLARANCAAKDARCPMSSVCLIHGNKSTTILTALASEGEIVSELISLVRSFGEQALAYDDLSVGATTTLTRRSINIGSRRRHILLHTFPIHSYLVKIDTLNLIAKLLLTLGLILLLI